MPEGDWLEKHNCDTHVSDSGIIGFRGPNRPKGTLWYNHMSAEQIRARIGDEIWNSYLKFCVVRDPFDKAVSAFFHFKKGREAAGIKAEYKSRRQRIHDLLVFFRGTPKFNSLKEEFEYWLGSGSMVIDRDKYMIDGKFCIDFVVRYEQLKADMESLCAQIGVAWEPSRLREFKKGVRDESVGLADIYTPKSIGIISELYSYELERFGYKAPELA
jgi:hypothetical protein